MLPRNLRQANLLYVFIALNLDAAKSTKNVKRSEGGRGVEASGASLREAAQVQVLNLKLIAQQILAKFRFHCAPKICLCLIRGNFLLFFGFFLFHLLLLPRLGLFLLLRVVFLVLLCEFVL